MFVARICQGNFKLELTQEELNTIIIALGQLSNSDLAVKSDENGVKVVDDMYKFYQQFVDYMK